MYQANEKVIWLHRFCHTVRQTQDIDAVADYPTTGTDTIPPSGESLLSK